MARLWSDDFVVTNPLNKFANKQQVLGMVKSGFLVITSYDRRIEYVRQYADVVIVAGADTVVWGGKIAECRKDGTTAVYRYLDETTGPLAAGGPTREHRAVSFTIARSADREFGSRPRIGNVTVRGD